MKVAQILALLTGAALVAAQSSTPTVSSCNATSAIPTCGVPCITSAASAIGCNATDFVCQCSSSAELQASAADCVISDCGLVTALEVLSSAEAICTECV